MKEERNVFTTGDIAKFCGVHFRTVIRWIEKGYLEAYQLPGRGDNRVRREALIAFLEGNKMPIPKELQDEGEDSQPKVLIVEDDLRAASSMERALKRAGFETAKAENGFAAGLLLTEFSPTVITLDLNMPGLGGKEVIQLVRSSEKDKATKILVVSAMGEDELQSALEVGADDILAKPFRNKELVDKVRSLMGLQLVE
ncbi:MAG: response regulator [Deltaproteobacteria bacterium]|nr:MAG: response regulator [Deltaproteobacteria bacterium]